MSQSCGQIVVKFCGLISVRTRKTVGESGAIRIVIWIIRTDHGILMTCASSLNSYYTISPLSSLIPSSSSFHSTSCPIPPASLPSSPPVTSLPCLTPHNHNPFSFFSPLPSFSFISPHPPRLLYNPSPGCRLPVIWILAHHQQSVGTGLPLWEVCSQRVPF